MTRRQARSSASSRGAGSGQSGQHADARSTRTGEALDKADLAVQADLYGERFRGVVGASGLLPTAAPTGPVRSSRARSRERAWSGA